MSKCALCDMEPLGQRHRDEDGEVWHLFHDGTARTCQEPGRATDQEITEELRNEHANVRYRGGRD